VRVSLKRLYEKLPDSLKEWAQIGYHAVPPRWRYGKQYRNALSLFERSEWWDEEKLREYQEERLRLLVSHCYKHVPYYRKVFQERGLTPGDIRGIEDLPKLPFLTKDIVIRRGKELLANNIPRGAMESAHTSGSSGSPLTFYMDRTTRPVDRALALRRLLWLGYREGDVKAFFKSLPLTNPRHQIKYFPGARELRISFCAVDDDSLDHMLDAMDR
jgi:phenylacetate-CoA ligase